MKTDITNLTFTELVELRDQLNNMIYSHNDGYFYIVKVRSYGRHWKEYISNLYTLQELCNQYNGDDGIVDVYSNNPELNKLSNYGDVMFVPTEKDYQLWYEHKYLVNRISSIEKELNEWDNRDNVPFNQRPTFAPIYSREYLDDLKKELEGYDMSFVAPVPVQYDYED